MQMPPLNALRAFEAASRLLSFKLAADELCVTPGAVSRHIRHLEEHLRARLFARSHRQVALTPAGRAYAEEIRDAFRRIQAATASVAADGDTASLKVRVPPTFAIKWLVPRLGSFQARCPDVSVQISTPFERCVFEPDVDVAVYYPEARFPPDIVSERLFREVLFPVISPRLARSSGRLGCPDDLADHTLLHSTLRPDDWREWLAAAGATAVDPADGVRLENSGLVYQGLAEGLGVAVAQLFFVADDLLEERLEVPFRISIEKDVGYFLVYPRYHEMQPNVMRFCAWIREEAAATNTLAERHFGWAMRRTEPA